MPRRPAKERTITQLRIEPDLWQRAQAMAERLRMSANSYVCNAVERQLLEDEARHAGFYSTGGMPADRLNDE